MGEYAYLHISLGLFIVALALVLVRPDLVKVAIKIGLIGGLAGLAVEPFYLRDYWRPPTLLGTGKVSIEDFLFGVAIVVLSALIYPVLFKQTFVRSVGLRPEKQTLLLLFLGSIAAMFVFNIWLGFNSMFITTGLFLAGAIFIMCKRVDLIKPSLVSAALVTVIAFVIYLIVFTGVASPHFWKDYWLLYNTNYDVMITEHIPLTEMAWFFFWALLGGVCYPFASGKSLAAPKK